MLFQKEHDFVHGFWQRRMDVDVVEDIGLVVSHEAPALNPSVVEVLAAVEAVEQYATLARHQFALFLDHNPQALECSLINGVATFEIFGDGFEVEGIQREFWHREGIEAHTCDPALQLGN